VTHGSPRALVLIPTRLPSSWPSSRRKTVHDHTFSVAEVGAACQWQCERTRLPPRVLVWRWNFAMSGLFPTNCPTTDGQPDSSSRRRETPAARHCADSDRRHKLPICFGAKRTYTMVWLRPAPCPWRGKQSRRQTPQEIRPPIPPKALPPVARRSAPLHLASRADSRAYAEVALHAGARWHGRTPGASNQP
jgi:hypothetical protein